MDGKLIRICMYLFWGMAGVFAGSMCGAFRGTLWIIVAQTLIMMVYILMRTWIKEGWKDDLEGD